MNERNWTVGPLVSDMARALRILICAFALIVGWSQALPSGTAAAPVMQTCDGPCHGYHPLPAEQTAVRQVVDRIIAPYQKQYQLPGIMVGVSIHGRRYFFPYGQATDKGAAFTADTLVEIGSCTKTFTTTIFAAALNSKQISSPYARTYMPNAMQLQPNAQNMTLLELADFSSGMPRYPPGSHDIKDYTTHDFLTWVSSWNPTAPPPAPYKYSNAGVGLLSYLVADATGMSWEEQLRSDILKPLGMHDTTLHPSTSQEKRLAMGHDSAGKDVPPYPISAWYAAGGLRSTTRDMLRFGEANLGESQVDGHPVPYSLSAAMQLAQTPIYTLAKNIGETVPSDGKEEQAMAWVTVPGDPPHGVHPVIWKGGDTTGFDSVIATSLFNDVVVFIVVNQNGRAPTSRGIEMAQALQSVK
jgi:CubicO group peptidase (beta-lactamase class C family)